MNQAMRRTLKRIAKGHTTMTGTRGRTLRCLNMLRLWGFIDRRNRLTTAGAAFLKSQD
jgi:hypothetical protein